MKRLSVTFGRRRSSVLGCELVRRVQWLALTRLTPSCDAREPIVAGAVYEISSGKLNFSEEVAVPSTETPVCAGDRTNSRLHIALPERNEASPP